MIQDLASLLWVVNLGCIDLNPWYARCDDVDRPDYLHFDLDPVPEATYAGCRRDGAARAHRPARASACSRIVKTTGSRGLHVYVAIVRGPTQKQVWRFAKRFAFDIAALRPDVITAEYRIAKRPAGPRPRRLQPERLGAHPRLGVLAAAAAARDRLGADHLGRARRRRAHRGLRPAQHAGARRRSRRPVGAAARRHRPRFDLGAAAAARSADARPHPADRGGRGEQSFNVASSCVELGRLDRGARRSRRRARAGGPGRGRSRSARPGRSRACAGRRASAAASS